MNKFLSCLVGILGLILMTLGLFILPDFVVQTVAGTFFIFWGMYAVGEHALELWYKE